jgi:hypothetical protein
MTSVATHVPAETDILCEGCGYTLNGLPADTGRCPECGKPIAESLGSTRVLPEWERPHRRPIAAFFATSTRAAYSPTKFYRTLATRRDTTAARSFARIHWAIASLMFALAATGHLDWYNHFYATWYRGQWVTRIAFVVLLVGTYAALAGVTGLAARLTNWEGTYRGYRLPLPVVLRGMYYHAVHYFPVALLALLTVLGYRALLDRHVLNAIGTGTTSLYVLCGEVILGAVYLFETYWIGMRNMMYANR